MIVAAQPKQFTLKDDGQIYFQPDSTNPMPGEALAIVRKGESLLQPSVCLLDGRNFGTEPSLDVLAAVETWLKAHIYTILEPLFNLVSDENLTEPVKDIALKLFSHTGILPRGEVEESLAKLDAEMRKILRDKKVRLGPLLIFLPDLNKPAAVKLRAILWSLFNDKPLPAPTPRDGAMSSVIDITTANADFYRAIGYPLYGARVVRIDMLDRVINAIYDSAKEGKFQAQHKMAEWIGCPIADLYSILEAMGHKRIIKPASTADNVPVVIKELAGSVAVVDPVIIKPVENLLDLMEVPVAVVESEKTSIEVPIEPKSLEQKKPELDWFFLRRGKAHVTHTERPLRTERAERPARKEFTKPDKPSFPAERYAAKGQKSDKKKSEDENIDRKPFRKKKFDNKKRDEDFSNKSPRIYSAEASVSDNPFAILQNLKLK